MDFLKLHFDRLRWATVPAVLAAFVLFCQPAPSLAQQQVNAATWMSDQSNYIANVPLKGIAMLGTHDAAMFVETDNSDLAKTQITDYNGQLNLGVRWFDTRIVHIAPRPGFPGLFEPDGSTTCPFVTGAYSYSGPGYYLYGHGGPDRCSGVTLSAMLDEVSQFLDQHPQEIVLLQLVGGGPRISNDSSGYPNANQDVNDVNSAAAFEAVLDQHLRRASDNASYIYDLPTACRLAGYQYGSTGLYRGACSGSPIPPQEVTPQQLYTTSARVILLDQFGLGVNLPSGISPQLTWVDLDNQIPNQAGHERLTGYFSDGACESDVELLRLETGSVPDYNLGLYGYRPSYQSYEADSKFLTMQAELTPYGAGTDKSLCGVSPIFEAQSFNPQLNSALQSTWNPYSVNIVSIDRADDEGVFPNVVAYNQRTFGRVTSPYALSPTRVVVGRDGGIYELAGGTIWQRVNNTGLPTDWVPLGYPANRFAVDPTRTFWTIDSGGNITLLPLGFHFTVSGLQFKDIAAGTDGAIYAISTAGNLYQLSVNFTNLTLSYSAIPGIQSLMAIAAGPANTLTAIDASGKVLRYISNGNWSNLYPELRASSVAVDDGGNVWVTGTEIETPFGPNPINYLLQFAGGIWSSFRNDGVQVTAGGASGSNVNFVYALSLNSTVHNLPYNLTTGVAGQAPPPKRYAATVSVSGLTFDHATQLFTGTMTVTNNTSSPITDQLAVVYQGLPSGVTVANNPLTYQGLPFTLMPTVTLQPGDSTSTQVQFSDPNLVHINYQTEVFAYKAGS